MLILLGEPQRKLALRPPRSRVFHNLSNETWASVVRDGLPESERSNGMIQLSQGLNTVTGLRAARLTLFRGYIDDSGDSRQVFTLSCLMAKAENWQWIEMDWKDVISRKNNSLARQARRQIRRFHAVDLNNFAEDFEGWTPEERKEFSVDLLHVFEKPSNRVNGFSCSVELQTLIRLIPEAGDDPIAFANDLLLKILMIEIGDDFREANGGNLAGLKVELIHDRGSYNGVLQNAFQNQLKEPTFRYSSLFTALAPMGWEQCIPLQPADLLASENFKETLRHVSQSDKDRKRDRRIPLKELLESPSFGGFGECLGEDAILELRRLMDEKAGRSSESQA